MVFCFGTRNADSKEELANGLNEFFKNKIDNIMEKLKSDELWN